MEELSAETAYFLSATVPFMWMSFALPAITAAICAPGSAPMWRVIWLTMALTALSWGAAATHTDALLNHLSESLLHRLVAAALVVFLLIVLFTRAATSWWELRFAAGAFLANAAIATDTGLAIAGSTAGATVKLILYLAISAVIVGIVTALLRTLTLLLPVFIYVLFLLAALIAAISVGLVPRLGELYYLVFPAI